jgi:hypothetical protein
MAAQDRAAVGYYETGHSCACEDTFPDLAFRLNIQSARQILEIAIHHGPQYGMRLLSLDLITPTGCFSDESVSG